MASFLHVAALNITTSPPSTPEQYERVLLRAFRAHQQTKLQGDWVGLIGACRIETVGAEKYIAGAFYKYIALDVEKDWFNVVEGKKAAPSDLAEISIPEHLKPHFQLSPFVFFPKGHRLFFIAKDRKETLSPIQARKIIVGALGNLILAKDKEFESIDVIIEQSQETLDTIFSMEQLRSLTIEIVPPNAFSDAEETLLSDMTNERITKKRVTTISDVPLGLKPSPQTKLLAKLALSLGKVVGRGKDAGKKMLTVSTTDHPYIERVEFFPNLELPSERLYLLARDMFKKITSRK